MFEKARMAGKVKFKMAAEKKIVENPILADNFASTQWKWVNLVSNYGL